MPGLGIVYGLALAADIEETGRRREEIQVQVVVASDNKLILNLTS